MPEKRLVIFDLDNTLVLNKPASKQAYESAIRFFAKETNLDFNKLYNHWKKIVQQLQTESAPEKRAFEYSLALLASKQNIADKYIPPTLKMYEKELLENLRIMPGAKELVSWLKEEGSLVAVAAGTDRTLAKKKLKQTGLYEYMDAICTAADVEAMKPNPAYYTSLMEKLEVDTNQTAVVSDSLTEDIEPAKKLGLTTFQLPTANPHLTALKPDLSNFLSFAK